MKNFEVSEECAIKLGILLKKRREELGYSTNYMEIKTGINKADLSRIENGKKKKLNPIYLKELSNILRLNQIELFNMVGFIDDKYVDEKNILIEELKEPIEMMTIPVFSNVAAGLGFIPDTEPIEYITIPELSGNCIGAKVKGESMEPTFYDGDIVIFKKEIEVGIGEIGVFQNKNTGEALVKRLKKKNGVYVLESDNYLFSDIEIKTNEIVCCGKVVNIVKKDLKKRVNPLLEKIELLDLKQQKIIEMMINSLLDKED